jgi:hypothetical protein
MKHISTGTGLWVIGLCLAPYPIIDRVMPRAEAGATHVAAVVAAATAQVPPEPTIVWYGVTAEPYAYGSIYGPTVYVQHRLWSDGRAEVRKGFVVDTCSALAYSVCPWTQATPPPSGNGFACRADLDGNRIVDGADLGMVLANWGPQTPCAPEASYPCLTLNRCLSELTTPTSTTYGQPPDLVKPPLRRVVLSRPYRPPHTHICANAGR